MAAAWCIHVASSGKKQVLDNGRPADGPGCPCVLAGKRAPELACGALQHTFEQFAGIEVSDVSAEREHMSARARAGAAEEFLPAKRHCFL
eukprot:6901007-Alexandrium_andersonii.AAC.1